MYLVKVTGVPNRYGIEPIVLEPFLENKKFPFQVQNIWEEKITIEVEDFKFLNQAHINLFWQKDDEKQIGPNDEKEFIIEGGMT